FSDSDRPTRATDADEVVGVGQRNGAAARNEGDRAAVDDGCATELRDVPSWGPAAVGDDVAVRRPVGPVGEGELRALGGDVDAPAPRDDRDATGECVPAPRGVGEADVTAGSCGEGRGRADADGATRALGDVGPGGTGTSRVQRQR